MRIQENGKSLMQLFTIEGNITNEQRFAIDDDSRSETFGWLMEKHKGTWIHIADLRSIMLTILLKGEDKNADQTGKQETISSELE